MFNKANIYQQFTKLKNFFLEDSDINNILQITTAHVFPLELQAYIFKIPNL